GADILVCRRTAFFSGADIPVCPLWEQALTLWCSFVRSVRPGYHFLQGGRVYRLRQVLVKAGLPGPAAVLIAAVAGDGNHAGPGCDRIPTQVLRDVVAIHPRQANVAEDNIGVPL